jgi:hypothetical protein
MRRQNCKSIVFELQSSNSDPDVKHACRARMRHFRAFVTILDLVPKEIDIEYVKPRLSLWDDEQREERQHLIYARVAPPIGSEITKHKLEEVMSFLYGETYADQFEDDQAKDAKYREYLGNLKKRVMDGLVGESVSMSKFAGHHTAKVMMLQMC